MFWFSRSMPIPADIWRLVLTSVVSAVIGGAAGYAMAWYRLRHKRLSLIQRLRDHRSERLALHRELYQHSTSRIHRSADPATLEAGVSVEELEQLRLEMMLLREDHRIETQLLKEENEELREAVERVQTTEARFMDVPEPYSIVDATPEAEPDSEAAMEADEPPSKADEVPEEQDEKTSETPIEEIHGEVRIDNEAQNEEPQAESPPEEPQADLEEAVAEDKPLRKDADGSASSSTRKGVPEDIQALFLPDSLRRRKATQKDPEPNPAPEPEHEEQPGTPVSSAAVTTAASELDADGFHFHWEAPRPTPPAKRRHAPEPVRMDMPAFRSLYDMLQASGVTLSPDEPQTTSATDLDPVHRIVGLDRDSYALLVDLGYASLEQLARLSDTETRRLAAVFRISPDRIRDVWTPGAQATLQGNRPESRD